MSEDYGTLLARFADTHIDMDQWEKALSSQPIDPGMILSALRLTWSDPRGVLELITNELTTIYNVGYTSPDMVRQGVKDGLHQWMKDMEMENGPLESSITQAINDRLYGKTVYSSIHDPLEKYGIINLLVEMNRFKLGGAYFSNRHPAFALVGKKFTSIGG